MLISKKIIKIWLNDNHPSLLNIIRSTRKAFQQAWLVPRKILSRAKTILGLQNKKIFCIGRNKTGTTSLAQALTDLGYRVGDQRTAELLMEDWGQRDFKRIIQYCHTADAFQDIPFSLRYTFQAIDTAFPGSKFILSVRDSADQWYQSLVRFHSMRLENRTGIRRVPSIEDIKEDTYVY